MDEPIKAVFTKQAPVGLAKSLRDLADAVDRGEVVEAVVAFTQNNEYGFIRAASLQVELVLSTLLQERIIHSFYV